jgi:hypothetical protein
MRTQISDWWWVWQYIQTQSLKNTVTYISRENWEKREKKFTMVIYVKGLCFNCSVFYWSVLVYVDWIQQARYKVHWWVALNIILNFLIAPTSPLAVGCKHDVFLHNEFCLNIAQIQKGDFSEAYS